jgi:long-chain acyl-CoA synthetase
VGLAELLARGQLVGATSDAWRYGDARATYPQFANRVARIASGLSTLSLSPGDRVVLDLPNCPYFLEMLWATVWAGLVAVPVNWHLHPAEVAHIIGDCDARAIVTAAANADHCEELPASVDAIGAGEGATGVAVDELALASPARAADCVPEATAWLFYTSGTTGRPKGAMLSHRNLTAMAWAYYADVDRVDADAVYIHAAPLSHGSGLYSLPIVGHGATQVIYPHLSFDPDAYLDLVQSQSVTHAAFLSPTMLMRLASVTTSSDERIHSLRSIMVGGAPLYSEDLVRAQEAFGGIVNQMYGQGESPMTITAIQGGEMRERRTASCGRPLTGIAVHVVDTSGDILAPEEPGEVVVSGDTVMTGYWGNPEASARAVVNGWLHTGDIGHFDSDGYLFLTDRAKDVIITGGTNVYPREVEEVLLSHPAVSEVAVIGIPDTDWGESICAVVVLKPGLEASAAELVTYCQTQQASFKKPRLVVFTDGLPKNATGKVLKRELRTRFVA